MIKHLDITVEGRVQGVGFRYAAKERADALNLTGYARNLPEGHVFVEVEGSDSAIKQFVTWCKEGSSYSKVEKVSVSEADIKRHTDFKIY